jgi:hypothetical protein
MATEEQLLNGEADPIARTPDGQPVLVLAELSVGGEPIAEADVAAECLSVVFNITMVDARLAQLTDADAGLWLVPVSESAWAAGEGVHEHDGYQVSI